MRKRFIAIALIVALVAVQMPQAAALQSSGLSASDIVVSQQESALHVAPVMNVTWENANPTYVAFSVFIDGELAGHNVYQANRTQYQLSQHIIMERGDNFTGAPVNLTEGEHTITIRVAITKSSFNITETMDGPGVLTKTSVSDTFTVTPVTVSTHGEANVTAS